MPVDKLILAILADAGAPTATRTEIDGFLEGYVVDRPMSARAALEPVAGLCGEGYVKVGRTNLRGHTVVWEAVHGPVPKGMVINHINFDRADNRIENLELNQLASPIAVVRSHVAFRCERHISRTRRTIPLDVFFRIW